jgi:hypothetical protein
VIEWLKDNWQWGVAGAAIGWVWLTSLAHRETLREHAAVLNQHAQTINELMKQARDPQATSRAEDRALP